MVKFHLQKKLNAATGEMLLDIDCEIEAGQLVTLYGKSGAGKTSTIRMLAGLMQPDKANIEVNGTTWFDTDKRINLQSQKRKVGFVFQDYALFPNMTVVQNLMFALKKGQPPQIIHELIDIVELGDLQNRKPNTLSGGQKQRVALARALVQKPELLMLDEPLSALDYEMRYKLQDYILKVHREYKLTTLLISHDIAEIKRMADRVLMIENGRLIRKGTPEEVLEQNYVQDKLVFHGKIVNIEKRKNNIVLCISLNNDSLEDVLNESDLNDFELGEIVKIYR